jgi:hypothetical protein
MIKQSMMFLGLMLLCAGLFAYSAGDGTEANPFQIATLEDLQQLSTTPADWIADKYFIQTADIDATDTQNWNDGAGFSPIGNYNVNFSGIYNGDGYVINSLYIYRPSTDYVGLFKYTYGCIIESLGLINVNITGNQYVGGLVGKNFYNSNINYCYSTGNVSGAYGVGGLIGSNSEYSTISYCHSTGNVSGTHGVGGLIGYCGDFSFLDNSFSLGNVITTDSYRDGGGLVGMFGYGIFVSNSYYDYEEVFINGEHQITIGALSSELFAQWLDNDLNLNIDNYLNYNDGKYIISNVNDFKLLLAFCEFQEYQFLMDEDIDLENNPNFYIPYFKGSFDGNNNVVSNFSISDIKYDNVGLFGFAYMSSISNLGLEQVNIISDCSNMGGLVGFNVGTIDNCYTAGNIQGQLSVGGLVGNNHGSITNCNSSVIVESLLNYAGGLVGRNENSISYSFSTGNVICGANYAGGITGYNLFDSISFCFSNSNITGNENVGGLVGYNKFSYVYSCYSTGNVNGSRYVGGLIGINGDDSSIYTSYSTGNVEGNQNCGGLIGYNYEDSMVSNSFWDVETSATIYSDGGVGRTTDEMTFPYATNTYVEWNFTEEWQADENYVNNNGYPFLRNQPTVDNQEDEIEISQHLNINNFPNPFNPTTIISFELPNDSNVRLEVFNVKGQKLKTLISELLPAGSHSIEWNGKDNSGKNVGSGVYFYKFQSDSTNQVRKMLMLK